MKPFARMNLFSVLTSVALRGGILVSSLALLAAGCETFKEPQDDTVWFDLNVKGYPCVTLGGQQIVDSGELYDTDRSGVQIGLVNYIEDGWILPLVN